MKQEKNYDFGMWKQDVLMFLRLDNHLGSYPDDILRQLYDNGFGTYQAAQELVGQRDRA